MLTPVLIVGTIRSSTTVAEYADVSTYAGPADGSAAVASVKNVTHASAKGGTYH